MPCSYSDHNEFSTPNSEKFLKCWSCSRSLKSDFIRRDGIIQSRNDQYGGPYFFYSCPGCAAENMCEQTARGSFFASPPYRPTIVEWLLGKLGPSENAETFLKIAAWFQDKEELRRYVFERDGDFRYSSFIERFIWYFFRRKEETPRVHKEQTRQNIPSPYKILGVNPGASQQEIKKAFFRLVKHYHPDKFHHLGPDKVHRAEVLFKKLLSAYEKLTGKE